MRLWTKLLKRVHRLLMLGAYVALEMMEKTFFNWVHLFTTIEMWSFHSSFESRIRPKNSILGAFGMRWPCKKSRGSSPGLYNRVKETVEDFEAENLNFHLRPHLDTFSM
jgi:hypothetical protein